MPFCLCTHWVKVLLSPVVGPFPPAGDCANRRLFSFRQSVWINSKSEPGATETPPAALVWKGWKLIHSILSAGRALWVGTSSTRAASRTWKAKKGLQAPGSCLQSQHLHPLQQGYIHPKKTSTQWMSLLTPRTCTKLLWSLISLSFATPPWEYYILTQSHNIYKY